MTDNDARIADVLKALEAPAYYAGAFGAFVEEVKDIRETFERCGAFAFRQQQWRMLVRDYECAYKACAALSAECARLREAIAKAADAIERVELSQEGWEDDEDIVCLDHEPIGMTIGRRGGPDFGRWWPHARKILAQRVHAALDAAKEGK